MKDMLKICIMLGIVLSAWVCGYYFIKHISSVHDIDSERIEYQEYLVVKEKKSYFSKAHNYTFVDFYVYKNGKNIKVKDSDVRYDEVNVGDTVLCGIAQYDDGNWFYINLLRKK